MLERQIDLVMRAAVLEGLFARPFGTWCRFPRPLDAVRSGLSLPEVERLEARGWFSESDWTSRVPSHVEPDDWQDTLCQLVFRENHSRVHMLGTWLRRNDVNVSLSAAVCHMRRCALMRLGDGRNRDLNKVHLEEYRGLPRSLPPAAMIEQDHTVAEYLIAALLDRANPVGHVLRSALRDASKIHYASGRWRTDGKPMLRFLDLIGEGTLPSARMVAAEFGMTRTAFYQRHLVQHLLFFIETIPKETRIKVRTLLVAQGCPYEVAQRALRRPKLRGWAESHARDGLRTRLPLPKGITKRKP